MEKWQDDCRSFKRSVWERFTEDTFKQSGSNLPRVPKLPTKVYKVVEEPHTAGELIQDRILLTRTRQIKLNPIRLPLSLSSTGGMIDLSKFPEKRLYR